MGAIRDKGREAFRNYNTDGVPASGDYEPEKSLIRDAWDTTDAALTAIATVIATGKAYATKAAMNADLTPAAGTLAAVYNDPTDELNGFYAKIGATGTGSWAMTNIAFPASFTGDLAAVLEAVAEKADYTDLAVASTFDAAPALILPASTPVVDLYGKTVVGDYAEAARYRAVSTQPSHEGKIQVGSQWYELMGGHVMPDWFKRTGDADDGASVQRAADYLDAKNLTHLVYGSRLYDQSSRKIGFNVPVQMTGTMGSESNVIPGVNAPGGGNLESGFGEVFRGTAVIAGRTGEYAYELTNSNCRGAVVDRMTFTQRHPAVGSGAWTPTPYSHLFAVDYGIMAFGRVMLMGIDKFYFSKSHYPTDYSGGAGRLEVGRVWGQVFTEGLVVDGALDVAYIGGVHFGPFVTANTKVSRYQQANLRSLRLGRVDGFVCDSFFSICHLQAVTAENMTTGGNPGPTTAAHFKTLYSDLGKTGIKLTTPPAKFM